MGIEIEYDFCNKEFYKIKLRLVYFFQIFSMVFHVGMVVLVFEYASYFLVYGISLSLIFMISVNFIFETEDGSPICWILKLKEKLA